MSTEAKRERKVGQGTGYETDGTSFWLAPKHVESWGLIQDQERSLDSVLEQAVRTVADARRYVEAARRKWWDAIYDDLELDKAVVYQFSRIEGRLSPVAKDVEP